MQDVVCIKDTFPLFPGNTPEEKLDRIQALSNTFYHKIWHGATTPPSFQAKFVNKLSSAEIQAYRQFNWLAEVFGGPSMFDGPGEGERYYKARTMAKHPPSRMTMTYSVTWLNLMKESIEQEFADHDDVPVKKALGTYWLHFFAMFPYSDDERNEFEQLIQYEP
jgi:truncated hemoglobin YjbI